MNEPTLRIGIFGAGNWTCGVHLPNLRRIPGVKVAAITSNSLEHRERARDAWGAPLCFYEEPDDLLRDEVDAVIVSTPNDTHELLSLAALRAGKHVYCEKPVAFTPEGVDRIERARAAAGVRFQAGLELRCCDVVCRMLALIRDGAVGAPQMIGSTLLRDWGGNRGWRSDPSRSGGMFAEVGVHYLDLFTALAGAAPARVFASGGSFGGGPQPESLWCVVEFANGARANLGLTVIAAGRKEVVVHVVGTEARLEAELLSGRVELWRRGEPEPRDVSPVRTPDARIFGYPGSRELLEDWIDAIRTGREPIAGTAVARTVTSLSAAAEASLQTGEVVALTRSTPVQRVA